MMYDPSALNDLGLPNTEGVYAFLHSNKRVELYNVTWNEGTLRTTMRDVKQLERFTDMEGRWLGKAIL